MAPKHPKRPRDPNQLAKHILDLATGEASDCIPETGGMSKLGRAGGLKGGADDPRREAVALGSFPRQFCSNRLVQKGKVRSGHEDEPAREDQIVKQTGHRYGFLDVHHRNEVRMFGRIEPLNKGRKGEFRDEPDHNGGIRGGVRVTNRSSAAAPDHPWPSRSLYVCSELWRGGRVRA